MRSYFLNAILCASLIFGFAAINIKKAEAQVVDVKKEYKKATKFYKDGYYNLALEKYAPLLRKAPKNADYNYRVGMCYYYTSSITDSAIYFLTNATKSVYKPSGLFGSNVEEKAPVDAYYYLGLCYKANDMPETAINHLKHYAQFFEKDNKSHENLLKDLDLQIQTCEREKAYSDSLRAVRTLKQDSLRREIALYKDNYLGTAAILDEQFYKIENLKRELEAGNKSQIKPLISPNEEEDVVGKFTVQLLATDKDLDVVSQFSRLSNVKKCRMPDGMYFYTIGSFSDRSKADEYCRTIRDKGYDGAWVRPEIFCPKK